MKAYIQCTANGDYYNVNAYVAAQGFKSLGFEALKYRTVDEISDLDPEIIFVGGAAKLKHEGFIGIRFVLVKVTSLSVADFVG